MPSRAYAAWDAQRTRGSGSCVSLDENARAYYELEIPEGQYRAIRDIQWRAFWIWLFAFGVSMVGGLVIARIGGAPFWLMSTVLPVFTLWAYLPGVYHRGVADGRAHPAPAPRDDAGEKTI